MPGMVRLRVLPGMPQPVRKRLSYRTRMLMADGDEFELSPSDAQMLRKTKWAEDVVVAPPSAVATRRRGRPPKVEAEPVAVKAEEYDLEDKTVSELREIAEEAGVELPPGYVRRDELIERIGESEDD